MFDNIDETACFQKYQRQIKRAQGIVVVDGGVVGVRPLIIGTDGGTSATTAWQARRARLGCAYFCTGVCILCGGPTLVIACFAIRASLSRTRNASTTRIFEHEAGRRGSDSF
ncbi:hypothetical protein PENSPDRAFT_669245 [Peniophora sp. CONT]|nr:hypothetical protein PENSPDRAFT_669245 [Peniophora sp. CONT]